MAVTIKDYLCYYIIPDEWTNKHPRPEGSFNLHNWGKLPQKRQEKIIKKFIKDLKDNINLDKLVEYLKKEIHRHLSNNSDQAKFESINAWISDELSFISNSLRGHFGSNIGDDIIKNLVIKGYNQDIKKFIKSAKSLFGKNEIKRFPITWFILENWKD